MSKQARPIDEHLGARLSGYVDGELTQRERQIVELHSERCDACRKDLDDLQALRQRVGQSQLSTIGDDTWRENMKDSGVSTTRTTGWLLLIGGLIIAATLGLAAFIKASETMSPWQILVIIGIYGGLGALFISVLRQRLIERKTDKYKDVEI